MPINFLFWNIHQNQNILPLIGQLVDDLKIHILLLAECSQISNNEIVATTNLKKVVTINPNDEDDYTPRFFTTLPIAQFSHSFTVISKRLIFCTLNTNNNKINIGGIHFPSKTYLDGTSQSTVASNYAEWVKSFEPKNQSTLIFGDFNMNPFEEGMIKPECFNATLSENIARRNSRKFNFKDFDYFYNPMWSFLGDKNVYLQGETRNPNTYFFDKRSSSDALAIFCNIFDQVIMRPKIIDIFDFSSLAIIDKVGVTGLVDANFIPLNDFSDHLPIKFSLNI